MDTPKSPVCYVILGRQGSGKGTQCELFEAETGIIHISTGDMLRQAAEAETEVGKQAKALMDAGKLLGDDIMGDLVKERLSQADIKENGVILDGFPRTPVQAEALLEILEALGIHLQMTINIEVDSEQVIERMLLRGRDDDTKEAIEVRLKLYEEQTAPLIDWFQARGLLQNIDGTGTPEEVFQRLLDCVNS